MCKISVAMATYNGEKYIKEQLESLLCQTKKPDEVCISDDCSTDNTVSIIEQFIEKNHLTCWKIKKNKENLGYKKNFLQVLSETSGDIIFMCDQDDIWMHNKIEIMADIMCSCTSIFCLAGSSFNIDGDGNGISTKEINKENIQSKLEKLKYNKYFYKDVYSGCVLAISKELLNLYKNLRWDFWGHDGICYHLALMMDGMYLLNTPVIYHRCHGNNVTLKHVNGNLGRSTLERRIKWVEDENYYYRKLKKLDCINLKMSNDIDRHLKCLEEREKFLKTKNIFCFMLIARFLLRGLKKHIYLADFAYAYVLNKYISNIMKKK